MLWTQVGWQEAVPGHVHQRDPEPWTGQQLHWQRWQLLSVLHAVLPPASAVVPPCLSKRHLRLGSGEPHWQRFRTHATDNMYELIKPSFTPCSLLNLDHWSVSRWPADPPDQFAETRCHKGHSRNTHQFTPKNRNCKLQHAKEA